MNKLKVQVLSIVALIHAGVEFMMVKINAHACHASMIYYCVQILAAMLDWVPYVNTLTTTRRDFANGTSISTSQGTICSRSHSHSDSELNFESIEYKLNLFTFLQTL